MRVALRSSAIGEDSELSFAGQYLSVLNVSSDQLLPTYKQVVASLYTSRAISYRLNKGIRDEDIAMSVACLEMIDSLASGIIYTHHPINPLDNDILISRLGAGTLCRGRVGHSRFLTGFQMDRSAILISAISHKPVQLIHSPEGGVEGNSRAAEKQDSFPVFRRTRSAPWPNMP